MYMTKRITRCKQLSTNLHQLWTLIDAVSRRLHAENPNDHEVGPPEFSWGSGSLNQSTNPDLISGGPPPAAPQSLAWPTLQPFNEPVRMQDLTFYGAETMNYPYHPRVPVSGQTSESAQTGYGQLPQQNGRTFEHEIRTMELWAMNKDLRRKLNQTKEQLDVSHEAIRREAELLSDYLEEYLPYVDGYQALQVYFRFIGERLVRIKELTS